MSTNYEDLKERIGEALDHYDRSSGVTSEGVTLHLLAVIGLALVDIADSLDTIRTNLSDVTSTWEEPALRIRGG
jgi:hypothetical protein